MNEIVSLLFSKQDERYRSFQASLIPNIDKESIIGIKTPELKKMAKEIGDLSFLETLSGSVNLIISASIYLAIVNLLVHLCTTISAISVIFFR